MDICNVPGYNHGAKSVVLRVVLPVHARSDDLARRELDSSVLRGDHPSLYTDSVTVASAVRRRHSSISSQRRTHASEADTMASHVTAPLASSSMSLTAATTPTTSALMHAPPLSKPMLDPGSIRFCPQSHWIADAHVMNCMAPDCGTSFSLFMRKHHCKMCGRIFCATCCSNVITVPLKASLTEALACEPHGSRASAGAPSFSSASAALLHHNRVNDSASRLTQVTTVPSFSAAVHSPTRLAGSASGSAFGDHAFAGSDAASEDAKLSQTGALTRSTGGVGSVSAGGRAERPASERPLPPDGPYDGTAAAEASTSVAGSAAAGGTTAVTHSSDGGGGGGNVCASPTQATAALPPAATAMGSYRICSACYYETQLVISTRRESGERRRKSRGELKMFQRALVVNILSYLTLRELAAVSLLSSDFYFMSRDNVLWYQYNMRRWAMDAERVALRSFTKAGATLQNRLPQAWLRTAPAQTAAVLQDATTLTESEAAKRVISLHARYNFTQFIDFTRRQEMARCEGLSAFSVGARLLFSNAIKLALIGPSHVGKTACIRAFLGEDAGHMVVHPTLGFTRYHKTVQLVGGVTAEVPLIVYDVSGAARYEALRRFICRQCHAIGLCYDPYSKVTLVEAADVMMGVEDVLGSQPVVVCGLLRGDCAATSASAQRTAVVDEELIGTRDEGDGDGEASGKAASARAARRPRRRSSADAGVVQTSRKTRSTGGESGASCPPPARRGWGGEERWTSAATASGGPSHAHVSKANAKADARCGATVMTSATMPGLVQPMTTPTLPARQIVSAPVTPTRDHAMKDSNACSLTFSSSTAGMCGGDASHSAPMLAEYKEVQYVGQEVSVPMSSTTSVVHSASQPHARDGGGEGGEEGRQSCHNHGGTPRVTPLNTERMPHIAVTEADAEGITVRGAGSLHCPVLSAQSLFNQLLQALLDRLAQATMATTATIADISDAVDERAKGTLAGSSPRSRGPLPRRPRAHQAVVEELLNLTTQPGPLDILLDYK